MQTIYIKTSQKILLKQYSKIFLLFSPFIFFYLFSNSYKKFLLFLMLVYYVPLSLIFIFELISNHNKTVIELTEEGIRVYNHYFFSWNSIDNFKTVKRKFRQQTMRRGIEIIEKTEVQINENTFNFETQYMKFSNHEIAEIIQIYKEKLENSRPNSENLPIAY